MRCNIIWTSWISTPAIHTCEENSTLYDYIKTIHFNLNATVMSSSSSSSCGSRKLKQFCRPCITPVNAQNLSENCQLWMEKYLISNWQMYQGNRIEWNLIRPHRINAIDQWNRFLALKVDTKYQIECDSPNSIPILILAY